MRFIVVLSSFIVASAAALTSCVDDGASAVPGGPPFDPPSTPPAGDACPASGVGSVRVTIRGLPAGVMGKVTLTGPARLTTGVSQDFMNQPAGRYEVSAEIVASVDPLVRTAYAAALTMTSVCARSGIAQAIDIAYSAVASSNKLWVSSQSGQSGDLLGFASAPLGASGSPRASVAAGAAVGRSLAFDKDGNLWTTSLPASVVRFAAADLGAPGPKLADRTIDIDVGGCSPALGNIAFDKEEGLWVGSSCAKEVVRLSPQQLAASGMPAPGVVVSSTSSPQGVAFDASGNLWITNSPAGTIARYDASRLATSVVGAASLTITPRADRTPGATQLIPNDLAFDAMGALWALDFDGNVVFKLEPSQLIGTGARDEAVSVALTINVLALLEAMAFDESGGLWLTFSQGKVARLAPSQLGQSTSAGAPTIPQTVITSADLGYANALAFYPSPAALPLYGSVR